MSKEIKVALLGIVALVLLYFGFTFLKGGNIFSSSHRYEIVYQNVDGLTTSNPVMLNGVQVGSVQEMELLPEQGNQILVTIELTKELQVGDSTIASLANFDILGSKAIVLYLGASTKMYEGKGERLIPYRETSITDMLSTKSVPVITKVDTTLARVNRLLDSEAKGNLQATMANVKETSVTVNEILVRNQRNIELITANLAQMTSALRQTQRKMDYFVANMNDITDTLKRVEINKLMNNANEMVEELNATVAHLNSNEGSLGKLMHDDQLYTNMNRSTEALNILLRDIQAYPKRYVQFSLIGRKDRYKVDATGRVITLEEVKDMQDTNPDSFHRPVPADAPVPPPVILPADSVSTRK